MAGASDKAVFGPALVAPLLVGSVLNPVNSSLIATALVPVAHAFSVDVGSAAVLVAALYLASAVAQPTMGKIADVVGPRRVFVAGLVLVAVGGLAGTIGPDFATVVAARILLGIGTSAGFPTAMLIIRRRVADTGTSAPGGLLGAIAMAGQATVAIGLPLGGALVGLAGWRATFAINLPLALAGVVLSLIGLPPDPPRARGTSWRSVLRGLDVPGLALFAATVTSLLICLMSLPGTRWWWYVAVPLCAVVFCWRERRAALPFVDVRILVSNKPLAVTYLRTCACFVSIYAVIYGVTQWLEGMRGLSSTGAGATMAPMSAMAVLAGLPVARRQLIRFPLVTGALIAVVVSAGLWVVTSGVAIPLVIALTVTFGVNVGFTTAGNQTAMYAQSVHEDLGLTSGLSRTSSNVGAILASTVVGLSYRAHGVTDSGLHAVALILLGISALIAVTTAIDRGLAPGVRSRRPSGRLTDGEARVTLIRGGESQRSTLEESGMTAQLDSARASRVAGVSDVIDGHAFHEWPGLAALSPYLDEGWRAMLTRPGDAAGPAAVKTQFLYQNPRGAKLASAYGHASGTVRLDREGRPIKAPAASDRALVAEQLFDQLGRAKVVLGWDEAFLSAGYANHYVAEAMVTAANTWTAEEWLSWDNRFGGVVLISSAMPDRAVAEIRRCGADPRFVAVALGPNTLSRPFGHPLYHPIYAACEELDLPVVIQIGSDNVADSVTPPVSGGLPATYGEYRALAVASHMSHLASMVIQGVFERFPRLRVLMVGGGATWLPGWLWRLDYMYKTSHREAPWLTRLPSEYVGSNVWISTDGLEMPARTSQLHAALAMLPNAGERIVYTSCYPNEDYEEAGEIAARLPAAWAGNVFHGNALKVLRWA